MAQILLNLESGLKTLINALTEENMDEKLEKLVLTLNSLMVPISKICREIRERNDAFGNTTCVVQLPKTAYKNLSNLYHILLNIYEEWKKGLICCSTIKKFDDLIYNINIDIPQLLEIILFSFSSLT